MGIMLLSGVAAIILVALTCYLTRGNEQVCLIATAVAMAVGLIGMGLVAHYIAYLYYAASVAVIAKAVSTGEVADDIVADGKAMVKSKFATVTVYYVIKRLIDGITHQITNGLDALGNLASGDNNPLKTIISIISLIISIMLSYLCDCCLGWVFLNASQNAFKSTCDGAVIYFKNWKTLLKNTAAVILITVLSLVLIALPIFAGVNAILGGIPGLDDFARQFAVEMAKNGTEFDPETAMYVVSAVITLTLWSILHTAFVRPFILIRVMRKYLEAGISNPPTTDLYGKLCGLSKSFKKASEKAELPQPVME